MPIPEGAKTFSFDAKWGWWDGNSCGDGIAKIDVPHCGIHATITRGHVAQSFSCDVSAIAGGNLVIDKPHTTSCEYVIIGNPKIDAALSDRSSGRRMSTPNYKAACLNH